jgi:hypothetical protein
LGYVHIGTSYGNPKIYSEGYYYRSGVGSKFGEAFRLNDPILRSKDNILTIINLKENEVAIVVNETITQVCFGPAKYVFIEPWSQAGAVVDLMSLNGSKYEFTHNGSIRAMAFHVPKGNIALVEIKNEKDNIRIFDAGHHVISDGGARFIGYIDIRNSEATKSIEARIKGGIKITWPITLTLEICEPIAFYTSKRKSPLDVIDDALVQMVSKFSVNYELKDIWGFNQNLSKENSIYEILSSYIFNDEALHKLSNKHGVKINHIVIGTFILDRNAEKIMIEAAEKEMNIENDLKQNELKIKTEHAKHLIEQKQRELNLIKLTDESRAKHELEQKQREIDKVKIEEETNLALYREQKNRDIERCKIEQDNLNRMLSTKNEALLKEEAAKRQMELDRMVENEKAARLLIQAKAEAEALLIKNEANKKVQDMMGKDYIQKKELLEIQMEAMKKTFGNTQKMMIDPRLGAKQTMGFFEV